MRNLNRVFSVLIVLMLFISAFRSAPVMAAQQPWRDKVDPWVMETAAEGETEFLVFLTEQADLSYADSLPTKLEKGTYVYDTLTAVAARTQGPLLNALNALGVEYRAYWIVNMIWVRGDANAIQSIAGRPDVAHLYANPTVHIDEVVQKTPFGPLDPNAVEWNIIKVNAPDLWALGYTGQDVVIGGQDTGYDWDHPALKDKYRGWNGSSADHNYNWHDAIHSGGGVCGPNSSEPCDDDTHGTHTMGTMVGDDGASNQIGMAPGAKWIGCRNMNQGDGTPASYTECYQWFIAPTNLAGANPNPAMAPDVINNSWGCPVSEGCTDPNVMLTVVNNVRSAGIMTVHSAGNSGSACGTIDTPSATYDASFTVGATDSNDNIASYSSRGPVTVDGSNRPKPDISAPGSNIRSSVPGGGYAGGWNGTSMAGPHVAGLVALLISVDPSLAGQVDDLETIIEQSAVPRTTTQSCGSVPGTNIPNNTYGWGRIDALAAYNYIITLSPYGVTVSPTNAAISGELGTVVTYTLTVNNNGTVTDTYDISLSGNTWTTTAPGVTNSLNPGQTAVIQPVVQIPVDAVGGAVDNVVVTITSQGDPSKKATATLTTSVSALYGLQLMPANAAQSGDPGTTVSYLVTLTNTGNVQDTFNFSVAGNAWTMTAIPSSVAAVAGGSAQVQIDVSVPPGALAGAVDSAAVTFTSQGNGSQTAVAAFQTTANAIYGLQSSPAVQTKSGDPGTAVVYALTVKNAGNIADIFDIHIVSDWPASSELSSLQLGAGESASLDVKVDIPVEAMAGEPETATVTFTSQGDAAKTDQSTLTTLAKALYGLTAAAVTSTQTVDPGETALYTLNITNMGNITDTFKIMVYGLWPSSTSAASIQLAGGAGGSIQVGVAVPENAAPGSEKKTSVIFISQGDATQVLNIPLMTSTTQAQPAQADLSVGASLSVGKPQVGHQFAYVIDVSNAGPAEATNAVLTVQLPSSVRYLSASLPACSEIAGLVTCPLGDLALGNNQSVEIVVLAVAGGTFDAAISVSAEQSDPSVGNDMIVVETETAYMVYLPSIFLGSN